MLFSTLKSMTKAIILPLVQSRKSRKSLIFKLICTVLVRAAPLLYNLLTISCSVVNVNQLVLPEMIVNILKVNSFYINFSICDYWLIPCK